VSEEQMEVDKLGDSRDFWFACVDIRVLRDRNLSPTDKCIYSVLCTFASTRGRTCFPKIQTLAEESNCSIRTVQESLRRLEGEGYISRRARYRGKKQISSEYILVGHKAPERGAEFAPIGGGVQNLHPRGAENVPPELEPIELNRTYSPSESEKASPPPPPPEGEAKQAPPAQAPLCTPRDVPAAMLNTAEFFLLKTGRQGFTAGELSAIRALEKRHTPARIQTEIGKALARYQRSGKAARDLTMEYIWDSLKHQVSLPGLKAGRAAVKKKAEEDPWEAKRQADMAALEKAMAESIARRFGGDGDP
jgi:DNA-binding Lrp family transcriptional regulator